MRDLTVDATIQAGDWPDTDTRATQYKGAASELTAAAWLLGKGYDVFRNVSPIGMADLIAVKFETGELLRVDVKTGFFNAYGGFGYPRLSAAQIVLGIRPLVVGPNGWVGFPEDYPKMLRKPQPKKAHKPRRKPAPDHPWRRAKTARK